MPFVGLGIDDLATALVVEFQHQLGVGLEAFRRGHLLDTVPFPETIGTAKRRDA